MNILPNPNIIFNSKRLIGKKYSDLTFETINKLPFFTLKDKETNKIKIVISFVENRCRKDYYYYPEQISAMILRKIKEDAEKYLSKKEEKKIVIKKAVITTPAYFNQYQRKETKQAAEIAGLEVIGMINEPTAASLAYGLHEMEEDEEEKKIIILDFGGGALDFTLLTFTKNNNGIYCDIEGSFGDPNFGGEDFDNELMNYILKDGYNYYDINEYQKLRLKLACEEAKIELSDNNSARINIEEFSEGGDINKEITKENFLDICQPLFKKFKVKLKEFIKICDLKDKKILISDIILIGGTTKIPQIKKIIEEEFPDSKVRNTIDPSYSVAKGAATFASMLKDPKKYHYINLNDVINFSIGTNVFDRQKNSQRMDIIIEKYSQLPAHEEKIYKTVEDNQTYMINDIYEGDKDKELPDNIFLGTFNINNLPKKKRGEAKIKLIFDISSDSILKATAIDLSNKDNHEIKEIPLKEPKGIDDKELEFLKKKEIDSEIIEFPGYNKIRDNIIEKQLQLESIKEIEKKNKLCLDILTELLTLVSEENEPKLEKKNEEINSQIYISYVKYIFSFAKNFFKNNEISIDVCQILKTKFMNIFKFIQFLGFDDNNNIDEGQRNELNDNFKLFKNNFSCPYQYEKNYVNKLNIVLSELLNYIVYNRVIYQYCISTIIESNNSKMKEFYYMSEFSNNFKELLNKSRGIQKLNLKLLKKIKIPEAIQKGVRTEIILYPLKIEIKEFLINYKIMSEKNKNYEYDEKNENDLDDEYDEKNENDLDEYFEEIDEYDEQNERFSYNAKKKRMYDIEQIQKKRKVKMDIKTKVSYYIKKIEKTENSIFYHYELEELKKLSFYESKIKKLQSQNDMMYLYELVKYYPPKRKLKYEKIKSKDDIKEELRVYIDYYENKTIDKKKEKIFENNDHQKLFTKIFFKDGMSLSINEDKKSEYIEKRFEEEEEHRKENDKYFEIFDKYTKCYAEGVRKYFFDNPYQTILDIISIYKNSDNSDYYELVLINLISIKKELKNNKDDINILLKNNSNIFKFYSKLLKKFPPVSQPYINPIYSYEFKDNEKFNSEYAKLKNNKNIELDESDDNEKFEYFKMIYEIYLMSYFKTENKIDKRLYLSILGELNKIRKEFEIKNYKFNSYYESKILRD